MAIDIRGHTDRSFNDAPFELATTEDEIREAGRLSADDVISRVNAILGYDIFEAARMAEGYAELGHEMFVISESTLSAQAEVLPPE